MYILGIGFSDINMLEKRKPGPLFPGFAYDDFMFVVFIKALLQASNTVEVIKNPAASLIIS